MPLPHRPYLDHPRPLSQATTTTQAMSAITGDDDQLPVVRPYTTDPSIRQNRRAATRMRMASTEQAIMLLGLVALVQRQDRGEAL